MRTIFHATPIPLAPGSVVLPGNWGRIIKHFGERHKLYAREMLLERIRAENFADKPSRLTSAFGCPDEQRIRTYEWLSQKRNNAAIPAFLYEAEIVDPTAPRHVADWTMVEPLLGATVSAEENAHRYWRGEEYHSFSDLQNVRCQEIVVASPIRIRRVV